MKKIVNLCIIIGAIGFFTVMLRPYFGHPRQETQATENNQEKPEQGYSAPKFVLEDAGGKQIHIGGEMKKAVYMNIWASWCSPCIAEAEDIQKVYEALGAKIDFVTINATHYDKLTDAKQFIIDHHWTIPVLFDLDGKVVKLYRSSAFPTSFLIDKHGEIKDIQHGIVESSELRRKLIKLSLEK
jgi:cytochrome c biogenesis protein CcmG/thiol:disulfide interchange protein DsbE